MDGYGFSKFAMDIYLSASFFIHFFYLFSFLHMLLKKRISLFILERRKETWFIDKMVGQQQMIKF